MTHIVFLMSDTGGGHRAAARAIEAALRTRHGDSFTTELVDLWRNYYPPPLNRMPETYVQWVNTNPRSYAQQYWVNDRVFRLKPVRALYNRLMFTRMRRMYREHPGTLYVCVHSVFVSPAVYTHRQLKIAAPFLTVITDWALPTVLWYDARADLTLVPTEPAYQRGLRLGVPAERLELTGAVIHPKFTNVTQAKAEARAALGWAANAQIVLLVGGGDGMGRIADTARAVDEKNTGATLVVIAGKNDTLRSELDTIRWRGNVQIHGFVDTMQLFMRAADLIITKAGPATITEAAVMGTPMIINGGIGHQETPNADYVVERGAGLYVTTPEDVAASVARVLSAPGLLDSMAENVRTLTQPDAIWRIADTIWSYTKNK
jgi:1,2-diacylglycerol 3-beta-galactosyltransferase